MVRNIDLPEALVFYGKHVFVHQDGNELLRGVESLIAEAKEIKTPVVVILNQGDGIFHHDDVIVISASDDVHQPSLPPPNPRVLYEAINSLVIQPRGFGGSSGFGRTAPEPERSPEFQHVVVFCDSIDVCRAARSVGARVMCRRTDNDLADAIVDEWDELCIDDIATPGSYWLNPPHPKDDEGNRVDIYDIMDYYERSEGEETNESTKMSPLPPPPPTMDDDEMARILADLDSI